MREIVKEFGYCYFFSVIGEIVLLTRMDKDVWRYYSEDDND